MCINPTACVFLLNGVKTTEIFKELTFDHFTLYPIVVLSGGRRIGRVKEKQNNGRDCCPQSQDGRGAGPRALKLGENLVDKEN